MKKIALMMILSVLVWGAPSAVSASRGCYLAQELEAEQGLRIHSELRVIGLTCQNRPNGRGLYQKYNKFTTKNQYLIGEYEKIMLAHFGRLNGDAEKQLNNLMTEMSNNVSQLAIRMNMVSFCQHYSPRLDQALAMDHDRLRHWARQSRPGQPASKPLCR